MTTLVFRYNKSNDLVAITEQNGNKKVFDGNSIHYLFDMFKNMEIKKVVVSSKDLIVYYHDEKIIIKDYDVFIKDRRYAYFKEHIDNYQIVHNEINRLLAQDIASKVREENKKNVSDKENSYKKRRIVTVSIAGVVLSVLIGLSLYPTLKDYLKDDEKEEDNNDEVVYYENQELEHNSNSYVKNKYGSVISKYAKKYGVPPEIVSAIVAHNIDMTAPYVSDEFYGAISSEYDMYENSSVAVYNFDTKKYELNQINKNDLISSDGYIRIICMLLQSNLRMCNYNLVAAVESMNKDSEDFKSKIIAYGISKYPEYSQNNLKNREFVFNKIINDYSNTNWLDMFIDENGSIYSNQVLSYITKGKILQMQTDDGKIVTFQVNQEENNLKLN